MRIAFPIIKSQSGSDIYFQILANSLDKHCINSEIIDLGYYHEFAPYSNRKVRKKLKKFDLIHSNIDYASLFKQPNQPLVSTLHHNVLERNYQKNTSMKKKVYHHGLLSGRIKRALQQSDALICVSHATAESFTASYGRYCYQVILNGIDIDKFRCTEHGEKNSKQLLFVGKLSHRKGADYIGPLMEHLGPDYTLYCATKSTGIRFKQTNIKIVNNPTDQDLVKLYNKSGFLISLSRIEGFGYSIAEGMACGCSIVSWRNSAIPELCTEGLSGHLIEEGNIREFANVIMQLAHKPSQLQVIANYNRSRVQQYFTDDIMIEKYLSIYRKLLE